MIIYNVNGLKVGLRGIRLGSSESLIASHCALKALGFVVVGWL